MSITPEDASPAAHVHASLHSLAAGSETARAQDELMDAIGAVPPNVVAVRNILSSMREDLRRPVLLYPSASTRHKLRTPLMAAAATGQMPIVGVVLAAFGDVFMEDGDKEDMVNARTKGMQKQLDMVDVEGMTLLMHACSTSSSAVFQALSKTVQPSQFREVIRARDAHGMTILHHAVNGNGNEQVAPARSSTTAPSQAAPSQDRLHSVGAGWEGGTQTEPPTTAGERLATVTEGGGPAEGHASEEVPFVLDPRLPVIQAALEFARANLWMPEYRKLLVARDGWHRSIIEHAIMSGRTQIFEAVFDALRRDIHDEKIDLLLDPGVESSHAQTSLRRAINSQEGTPMAQLVREKTTTLKSDVSKRKDDSTVAAKIQAFIPGNLIVIFQLLLPEFDESGDGPLYLLLVLCFVAPFWSWGAAMSVKRDPEIANTRARRTAAKYFLAIPAMFFWGVGTSKIAPNSFNWAESASAAALAVATIVIPALDTYFSGRGARATVSVVTIFFLDLMSGKKAKTTRAAERSNQLYGQDDDLASQRNFTSKPPPYRAFVNTNPRTTGTHRMDADQTPAIRPAPLRAADDVASPRSQRSKSTKSPMGSIWGDNEDAKGEV
ncbi:unnamed protein product [Ectocarpus fasciculatus]